MVHLTDEYKDCKDEQAFKMKYVKKLNTDQYKFCIETEETIKGFPDVLLVSRGYGYASFLEFKFASKGIIKFQPTQPAFYKMCAGLDIKVIAYEPDRMIIHSFNATDIFDKASPYRINEKGEVILKRIPLCFLDTALKEGEYLND